MSVNQNPDLGVAYIESACTSSDHVSSTPAPYLYNDSWMAQCDYQAPCAFTHASGSCLCVCHVFGIVMSLHMSPCHPHLAGEGRGYLGVAFGDQSHRWQHCIWPTAYYCQHVTSLRVGVNVSLLWVVTQVRVSAHIAWHGFNNSGSFAKHFMSTKHFMSMTKRKLGYVATHLNQSQLSKKTTMIASTGRQIWKGW